MYEVLMPFLALLQLASVGPGQGSIYRFGPLGLRLTERELSVALASALPADAALPLAVLGWYSQILPEVWYVDIFSVPSETSSRVRRGRVTRTQCAPGADRHCLAWESQLPVGEYAQVADEQYPGFTSGAAVRTERERPFHLRGNFSDDELLSLVGYIRSGPTEPNEVTPDYEAVGLSLQNPEPITDIERQPDGSVLVRTSLDFGSGRTASVVRIGDDWQLNEVGGWVK